METRVCTKCGTEKSVEEFRLRNQRTQSRQSYCNDCGLRMGREWYERNKEYQIANARKHTTEYRNAMKEYIYNYLLEHPCEMCGESDVVVLELHHIGEKDMAISEMVRRVTSIERLKDELSRCSVLCANCHRRVTAKERGWYRSTMQAEDND